MTAEFIDAQGRRQPDRRQQRQLREMFAGFRSVVEPFITGTTAWGSQDLSYLARRQIQESYPNLDSHQINVLFQAVLRVIREERGAAA